MSKWKLGKHVGLMLIVSLVASFGVAHLLGIDLTAPQRLSVTTGRALGATLFPLALFAIWRGIYRLFTKEPKPSSHLGLWILWLLIFVAATFGSGM